MSEHVAPRHSHSGTLVSTPIGGGPVVISDTISCCHCGCVWQWQPGSGRRRGWCARCGALTCGNAACNVCVPLEQQLANLEAGRPLDFRPIIASVTAEPPRG